MSASLQDRGLQYGEKDYKKQGCFDDELSRDQFRCLRTAYCYDQRLDVDTSWHDNDLLGLWGATVEDKSEKADWSDFDSFDNFMCKYHV